MAVLRSHEQGPHLVWLCTRSGKKKDKNLTSREKRQLTREGMGAMRRGTGISVNCRLSLAAVLLSGGCHRHPGQGGLSAVSDGG